MSEAMMSEQKTKIRGPHDIRESERYAWQYEGRWAVSVFVGGLPSRLHHRIVPPDELPDMDDGTLLVNVATGERFTASKSWLEAENGVDTSVTSWASSQMLFALISLPDEPELPETVDREPRVGDLVVCVDDSDISGGRASGLSKGETYQVTDTIGESSVFIDLGSGIGCRGKDRFRVLASQPADGSFHRPWPPREKLGKDGWHDMGNYRLCHEGVYGHSADGPGVVEASGKRTWQDEHGNLTAILPHNVFSDDLPGGGRDEDWSHGFEVGA